MKALISPNEKVKYINSWTEDPDDNTIYIASYAELENAQRVVEVHANEFDVAPPLFWTDCDASIVAEDYYYDTTDSTIKLIPNVAKPTV